LILAFTFQNNLIFFPQPLDKDYRYNLTDSDKEVFIPTSDGCLINGILFRRPANKNVVLYFHGNGGSLDSWQATGDEMLQHNCDLLIIDYRGYGKSTGKFSEKGFYDDAHSAYRFLIASGYQPNQIIAYGRSLGTGIATELATTEKIKALILESPYTSLPALASEKMPYLFPGLIVALPAKYIKKSQPVNCTGLYHSWNEG
jgi:pimeloyl-ACP methyl ester carboxylesterase